MKKVKIVWQNRYSQTMENDKHGRWGRTAHAGYFNPPVGFYRGKIAVWEIAWIKKLEHEGNLKFIVSFDFPTKSMGGVYDSVEEAQAKVGKEFRWFIKMVLKN